jgi:hypothetical protein
VICSTGRSVRTVKCALAGLAFDEHDLPHSADRGREHAAIVPVAEGGVDVTARDRAPAGYDRHR